jgi:hypothetical protein
MEVQSPQQEKAWVSRQRKATNGSFLKRLKRGPFFARTCSGQRELAARFF